MLLIYFDYLLDFVLVAFVKGIYLGDVSFFIEVDGLDEFAIEIGHKLIGIIPKFPQNLPSLLTLNLQLLNNRIITISNNILLILKQIIKAKILFLF